MSNHAGFVAFAMRVLCSGLICGWACRSQTPALTNVALLSSRNPSLYGQAVTLTAIVSAGATGKVTFYDRVEVVGVATLAGGQAAITTRFLPAGTRSLHAHYLGNSGYAASDSAVITQNVTAAPASGLAAAVNYPTVPGQGSMAYGDFDGDGKTDLAVANIDSNTVSIFLGNGDGTFGPRWTMQPGRIPHP
jgi:hypothetical protein